MVYTFFAPNRLNLRNASYTMLNIDRFNMDGFNVLVKIL